MITIKKQKCLLRRSKDVLQNEHVILFDVLSTDDTFTTLKAVFDTLSYTLTIRTEKITEKNGWSNT